MEVLTIVANIAQILSFFWIILFGALTLPQIVKAIINFVKNRPIHIDYKIISFLLAGLLIFGGISYFFPFQILIQKLSHTSSVTPTSPTKFANGSSPTTVHNTVTTGPSPQVTVTTVINGTISLTGTPYSNVIAVYNHITAMTPSWSDRLNSQEDASNEHGWSNYSGQTGCTMQSDAYEAFALTKGFVGECFASKTNFKDFAFQADMYILQGLSGGLIFRAGSPSYNAPMYRFDVSHAGIYDIYIQPSNETGHNAACGIQNGKNQSYCYSSSINQGYVSVMNQLMVIAQGSTMYFYVNGTPLLVMVDSTYSSGVIGVFGADFPDPTKVDFRNAEVWTNIPNIAS